MAISFDKAFGIHQYTLSVRSKRAEVLSSNIANADTPGFKARDINFSPSLVGALQQQAFRPATPTGTHCALHMVTTHLTQSSHPLYPAPVPGTTVLG